MAWDGICWRRLGTGVRDWVVALTVYENRLIAGGNFERAGDVIAEDIAAWNGSTWSSLWTDYNGILVKALAVYDNKLIVGGLFDRIGGISTPNIAAGGPR